LPGGGPESEDNDWKETLIREVNEEASVEIKDVTPSGYIETISLNNLSHPRIGVGIRAVARLKKINSQKIDPTTGTISKRKFIKTSEFLDYCRWSKNGEAQFKIALKTLRTLK